MSSERHNLIAFIRQVGAKEATRALKDYEGSIKKTTGSLGAFDIALGVTAGALATRGITALVGAAREGLVLSARMDTVSAGFGAFTANVDDSVISLKSLRNATKGTVADVDLLTTANNALALGLPVERLNELFEAARTVGNVMGRTTLQAVQDLSTGIGRQSRLILDNLGIVISAESAYRDYATTLGKTASQLTDVERRTAFTNAAMTALNEKAELLSGSVSETQTNLERWNSTIKNTTVFLGSFAGAILNVGARTADLATEFSDQSDVAVGLIISYNDLTGEAEFLDFEMQNLIETSRNVSISFLDSSNTINTSADAISRGFETLSSAALTYRSMMVAASDAAQQFFEEQATFVSGRKFFVDEEEEITPIQEQLSSLEDTLGDTQDQTDLLRLEQLKLTDAFKDGRISEEDYEEASASLEDRLRSLRILQSELRISIDQTTEAMQTQTEALDIGPLGEPTLPGETFTVPFVTTPELGSMFAGLAGLGIATGADRITNIEITVDVGTLSADPTEIEALVQQMAEALFKELQKRGGVP